MNFLEKVLGGHFYEIFLIFSKGFCRNRQFWVWYNGIIDITGKSEIHYRNKRKYVISTGMANYLLQQGHKLLEIKENKRVK